MLCYKTGLIYMLCLCSLGRLVIILDLVLCYSWCEPGRHVIASFVCNLIYLYGCFDSKIKIIWLWLLSVWCIFWLPNVNFADAILLIAHTVSAMRNMLKVCDLYARMPLTVM